MHTAAHEDRTEAMLAMLAAILLLFTAMLDPLVSAVLTIALLAVFAFYKLSRH
jgi:uncharacterized Tic20 family protein